jgi:hypothetical protein
MWRWIMANATGGASLHNITATKAYVDRKADLSGYAKKSDLEGFATEEELLSFYYPDGRVTSMSQVTTSGINYAVGDDGGACVTGGYQLTGNVVLPWKVTIEGKEYRVTAIRKYAFDQFFKDDYSTFTSFTAPITVKVIEENAFEACNSLKSVSFPSVTQIKDTAFANCDVIRSVSFPSVTTIGMSAFEHCHYLDSVYFPSVSVVSEYAFTDCASLSSISLPSATAIERGAFLYCPNLASVSAPSVESIGESAFHNCDSLTSISVPSVSSIGYRAFYNCTYLTTVSLPSVTEIGEQAFYSCLRLTSVDFGSTPKSEVPSVSSRNTFEIVPNTCKFVIPLGMYDEWIDAPGWSDLYSQGYKFEGYASTEQVKATIPKYEFVTATIVDGVVTVAPYTNAKLVSDGTAFTVTVGGESGYTRDCVLRVECSDTVPTITWGKIFHPRTDAEADFKCEAGKRNVYWITEYAEGEFVVASWQETTGGNAS